MTEEKAIRQPKQQRSQEKKQRIINAAKDLMCQKGYHSINTNEIARHAALSIGTLYSYFTDKDAILTELLMQYDDYFNEVLEHIRNELSEQLFMADRRKWLRSLVKPLIRLHDSQKAFYHELIILRHSSPIATRVLDAQTERMRLCVLAILKQCQSTIATNDIEALSAIIVDYAGALVDRVVFMEQVVDNQRIIDTGVEALYCMIAPQQAASALPGAPATFRQ